MYGILLDKKLLTYRKITTPGQFAKLLVKRAMNEENIPFNTPNIQRWICEWADLLHELSGEGTLYTPEESTCHIASNLVYSNCHHYWMRDPLTSEQMNEVYEEVDNFLIESLKK